MYDQFRNVETQGIAIAQGMRTAFGELFDRNEYVYDMDQNRLASLVIEVTGGTREERKTRAIVSTFLALKELADFEGDGNLLELEQRKPVHPEAGSVSADAGAVADTGDSVDLRVSYTINLNLPETTDPNVFSAIFAALRDNLLKK